MDSSWDHWFAVVAIIVSGMTAWQVARIKKHLHIDDLTPTRKWKKAIRGPKHVPKHQPDQVPEHADENAWRFFRDFARMAEYLNTLYKEDPWSFQNTGKLEGGYGQEAERKIEIRYNQQVTGWIELSCFRFGEDNLFGDIALHFNLINARVFNGNEVFGLAQTLAGIVCDTPEAMEDAKSQILVQMIGAMWQVGEEAFGNPELELRFSGKAKWYLSKEAS